MEGMEIKSEAYPSEEGRVGHVDIEKADNGWVVEYSVKEKSSKPNSMDHMEYKKNRKIFSTEEEDKAWELYVEYKKKRLNQKEMGYGY